MFIFDQTHTYTAKTNKWIGSGKGYRLQGVISAIAECFQHYLMFSSILGYTKHNMSVLPADEIASTYPLSLIEPQ